MASEQEADAASAEVELIERLRSHDASAWAELYDRHYTAIWRYAAGRTGSRESADDVAAQVFLEALQSIQRFRLQGKPIVAWLYIIARNHAAKSARQHHREAPGPLPEVPQDGIEDGVVDSLALGQAIARLTKDQREVLALRHYGGRSTAEIAQILGKRESAVYSTEARALAALRRLLATESKNLPRKRDEIQPSPGIEG